MAESILITGASGFVGSHLVEEALSRGYNTWAAIRPTSSRRYLKDERLHIIELDYSHPDTLKAQLQAILPDMPDGWDYVVHAAGATKAATETHFMRANYMATRHLTGALKKLNILPRKFIYISSFAAAQTKKGKAPDAEANTAYGRSKQKTEQFLLSTDYLRCVILRPTGIYGPREKDYLRVAKTLKRHINLRVGYRQQTLSFLYVKDFCQAVFLSLNNGQTKQIYPLSDGKDYSADEYTETLKQLLGVRSLLNITVPLWLLRLICTMGQLLAWLTGHTPLLNNDKYKILKQRDWHCPITLAKEEMHFNPQYDLQQGMAETISWYKNEKWI